MCLQAYVMARYDFYLWLLMGEHIVCMIYVDDCLIFSKEDKYIDALVEIIRDQNFELKYEDQSITGFLGMYVSKTGTVNDNTINFTTPHHIYCILDITGMNDYNHKYTLDIQTELGPDIDGAPLKETYKGIYAAVVGVLRYLSSNSHPNILLATKQVSRHNNNPKLSREI